MSESHRDHDQSSNISSSQAHRNSKDESERHSRKRSHLDMDNIDAKVYIGNISTTNITDEELLDFFKPFGKVSDIRVFKDHIFVQYYHADDAKKLISEARIPLIFKGNKLEVLPARDVRSTSAKSSSTDQSSKRKNAERNFHRQSSNYEAPRKRLPTHERTNFDRVDVNDRRYDSLPRSDSRRSSNDSTSRNQPLPYVIIAGSKNPDDLVDCQIIIVNVRQREYAEEIESRLSSHGIITSIILLREDYTLIEAIDNATRLHCLYGIIVMPMHEERRTASFHILHGETEEHRNLTLEDGIHIIVTNFISYKERLHAEGMNSYRLNNNNSVAYSESMPSYEYVRESSNLPPEDSSPPVLTLGDKLPLSMLLCLLADGRQLTLEEIDRVLVYLLEKKAKMLTLPPGTLPPLPAHYATINAYNHHTGSGIVSDTRSVSRSDLSPGKSSSTSAEVSSTIAEHIRQILSNNIGKTNASNVDTISQSLLTSSTLDKLSDTVKVENTTISQANSNGKEVTNEYAQQSKTQSTFVYPKTETVSIVRSPFNYTSSSVSTPGSGTPFATPNFSSYNSVTPSITLSSALKPTTSVTVPNFVSQPSQYFYPIPASTVYPSPLNSSAAEATAAILQAYSQFNVQSTATSSLVGQQLTTQQQQIRK